MSSCAAPADKADETEFLMLKDGKIALRGPSRRVARDRTIRICRRFCRSGSRVMPRTRSIAWSELKLGVVGIVALLLVVLIILAVGGQGGFWWQRYPLKTRFADAGGLKTGAVVR